MKTRIILAPLLWIALSLPAAAEKVSLDALSAYLNGLRTAETAFSQTNADGSTSTGKVFIKRPGRMRFEYAAPDKTLVLASGGQVAIFDAKSNQPPEQYPLKRTPLNLILGSNVNLATAKMVIGHDSDGKMTSILAQDPKNPEYGTIRLFFSESPVALKAWLVTDEYGGETYVRLGDLKTGAAYGAMLFNITVETDKRSR